jgi:perosamine synthetase
MVMKKKIKLIEPVVGEEELKSIRKVLRSGWLTEGTETKEFEERVKGFIGAKFAASTTSCTTALELALRALDTRPGDEVIVPDFTHPATGNIISWIGAKPVLVDVDLSSYNIDPEEVAKAITKKTKCILPVSWGGNPLNIQPLNELKERHDLTICEDAACSLGAEYNGKKTGKMADITCFSFHPRKIITTGEGGMAVTDNSVYAKKLMVLKNFGLQCNGQKSVYTRFGTNYKLSDILGAIGVEQMRKIEKIIKRRIELATYYDKLLAEVSFIRTPQRSKYAKHVYQTYAVYLEKEGVRNRLIEYLRKNNIETQIGTYSLHLQESYVGVRKVGELDRSKKLYRNLLTLPMCHSMTNGDQERVVTKIEGFLRQNT